MVGSSLAIAFAVVVVIFLGIVRDSRRRRSGAGALSPAPRAAGSTAATRTTVTTGAAIVATAGAAGSAGESLQVAAPNRAQLRAPGFSPAQSHQHRGHLAVPDGRGDALRFGPAARPRPTSMRSVRSCTVRFPANGGAVVL